MHGLPASTYASEPNRPRRRPAQANHISPQDDHFLNELQDLLARHGRAECIAAMFVTRNELGHRSRSNFSTRGWCLACRLERRYGATMCRHLTDCDLANSYLDAICNVPGQHQAAFSNDLAANDPWFTLNPATPAVSLRPPATASHPILGTMPRSTRPTPYQLYGNHTTQSFASPDDPEPSEPSQTAAIRPFPVTREDLAVTSFPDDPDLDTFGLGSWAEPSMDNDAGGDTVYSAYDVQTTEGIDIAAEMRLLLGGRAESGHQDPDATEHLPHPFNMYEPDQRWPF